MEENIDQSRASSENAEVLLSPVSPLTLLVLPEVLKAMKILLMLKTTTPLKQQLKHQQVEENADQSRASSENAEVLLTPVSPLSLLVLPEVLTAMKILLTLKTTTPLKQQLKHQQVEENIDQSRASSENAEVLLSPVSPLTLLVLPEVLKAMKILLMLKTTTPLKQQLKHQQVEESADQSRASSENAEVLLTPVSPLSLLVLLEVLKAMKTEQPKPKLKVEENAGPQTCSL